MPIYCVTFEKNSDFVEADDMREAIERWKRYRARQSSITVMEVDDPESVAQVSTDPIIR